MTSISHKIEIYLTHDEREKTNSLYRRTYESKENGYNADLHEQNFKEEKGKNLIICRKCSLLLLNQCVCVFRQLILISHK